MTLRRLALMASLCLAVVASGVAVVYVKYLTRMEFRELQVLTEQLHQLEEEWAMLQLEEASLSTHPRVEQAARTRLGMYLPRSVDTRTVGGDEP